jgi:hypothetical protein
MSYYTRPLRTALICKAQFALIATERELDAALSAPFPTHKNLRVSELLCRDYYDRIESARTVHTQMVKTFAAL